MLDVCFGEVFIVFIIGVSWVLYFLDCTYEELPVELGVVYGRSTGGRHISGSFGELFLDLGAVLSEISS